jgi:integrase
VKNGSAHIVPLSPLAVELFEEAIERAGATDLIFQNAATRRSITGHAVAKAMNRTLEHFGLEDVTPHDLRRTAATGMAKLGISRLVIDKVLNHVSADRSTIAGVYDRHAYQAEKRHALESWASHLSATLGKALAATNIVALRKSAS